jgi:LuxR family transcriptional regulator, maltose regulon positive regulatory protein
LAREVTAEALEGLATAANWLDDSAAAISAREQAYHLYRASEDRTAAARQALGLATTYYDMLGDTAVAKGWLNRARSLVDEGPVSPERRWVLLTDGYVAMAHDKDPRRGQELSAQAADTGRALGDVDLETMALAQQGLALVCLGVVDEGMRLLDGATAAATGGDMTNPEAITNTCCCLISACEKVRDIERATQWARRVMKMCEEWPNRAMFAFCRTQYAGVLIWRGRWAEAEAELRGALADLGSARPAMTSLAVVRLADLRRRQGRFEEAQALFEQAEREPCRTYVGPVLWPEEAGLALDRGEPNGAIELAHRFLRQVPVSDRSERAVGLEVLVRALAATDDYHAATSPLSELESITNLIGSAPLRASTALASGLVARAAAKHDLARECFEDAVDLFETAGVPIEAARGRLGLAESLWSLGRVEAGTAEAEKALSSFARLGATAEQGRVLKLLGEMGTSARRAEPGTPALTRREADVVRLVARGLTNQQIAASLFISTRTVERHLSNLYAKLGASGSVARAVATAFAHTHNLS